MVYERTLTSRDETLNGQIIGHLQATVPEDTIITNDAGNFAGWLHSFFNSGRIGLISALLQEQWDMVCRQRLEQSLLPLQRKWYPCPVTVDL